MKKVFAMPFLSNFPSLFQYSIRNPGNIAKAYLKETQACYIKDKIQQELILNLQNSYSSWKFAL